MSSETYSSLPTAEIAKEEDFDAFRQMLLDDIGWAVALDHFDKGGCRVLRKASDTSSVDLFKVQKRFKGIPAALLYDTLHDEEYRGVWDDHMCEGQEIERLGVHDDVGYYAMKMPGPLQNRDFCNQRSWRRSSDRKEFIIMNHSVKHEDCPVRDTFVRAISHRAGYRITVDLNDENSCFLHYMAHSDLMGNIPSWIINMASSKMVPRALDALDKAARGYQKWKSGHVHGLKPWLSDDGEDIFSGDDEEEGKKKSKSKKKKKRVALSHDEDEEEEEETLSKSTRRKRTRKVLSSDDDDEEEEDEEVEELKKKVGEMDARLQLLVQEVNVLKKQTAALGKSDDSEKLMSRLFSFSEQQASHQLYLFIGYVLSLSALVLAVYFGVGRK